MSQLSYQPMPAPESAHDKMIPCRLCGRSAQYVFSLRNMGRVDVKYYRCEKCESLETEQPYWLNQAYADTRRHTDTEAGRRAIRTQTTCYFLARLLGIRPQDRVLDWGGGDGLTTRLMRDAGLNAFNFDTYAENLYAIGFEGKPDEAYKMIVAVEVWEHFSEPKEEIAHVFAHRPHVLYVTTGRYKDQDQNWPYLSPHAGRHVFLYSEKAMRWIAEQHDYDVIFGPWRVVFVARRVSAIKRYLIRQLLKSGRRQNLVNALFFLLWGKGHTANDQKLVKEKMNESN